VPGTVSVPAGATTATFTVDTSTVSVRQEVGITATYNLVTLRTTLLVLLSTDGPSLNVKLNGVDFFLRENTQVDLDLKLGLADVSFRVTAPTSRLFAPVNGATLAFIGTVAPGREGCSVAPLSTAGISIDLLAVGTYLCVLTTDKVLAQLKITSAAGPSPGTVRFDYSLWYVNFT
jgi:hypothetical protein